MSNLAWGLISLLVGCASFVYSGFLMQKASMVYVFESMSKGDNLQTLAATLTFVSLIAAIAGIVLITTHFVSKKNKEKAG